MPPLGAGLYVGSGSMSLGLSGAAAQMHGFADHAGQSSSAAAAAAQFDHIMPPSSGPSLFRSQVSASSSSFFLGGGAPSPAQDFSDDPQGGQGSSLLHSKSPFQGLMQLPEQQHQPGSSNANGNLLNLGFFSGNGGGSAGGQDARLVVQDQFNGGGGGGNADHSSVMASMGSHLSCSSFPSSLYNSSPSAGLAQNSATALLMKAAQMGSTSSAQNGPSALLRAAGFSAASGQGTSRAAGEGTSHEAHFHDLIMNSLAGGSGGGGGFSGGGAGFGAVDDGKLSTRDFLGVGRGAMAPPGLHIGALDPAQMK